MSSDQVARQTVVAVEAGNYAPSVYLARAIALRLGATVEQLFGEAPVVERPGHRDDMEVEL